MAGTDYLRLNRFAAGQGDRGSVARSLAEFLNCFMHCYTAAVVSTQGRPYTLIFFDDNMLCVSLCSFAHSTEDSVTQAHDDYQVWCFMFVASVSCYSP